MNRPPIPAKDFVLSLASVAVLVVIVALLTSWLGVTPFDIKRSVEQNTKGIDALEVSIEKNMAGINALACSAEESVKKIEQCNHRIDDVAKELQSFPKDILPGAAKAIENLTFFQFQLDERVNKLERQTTKK